MATQKAFAFNDFSTTTHTVVASGGVTINAIDAQSFCSTAAAGNSGATLTIEDSIGTVLFSRTLVANTTISDSIHLSGLEIPTTSNGGLLVVITVPGGATVQWITGVIVYTVP